MKEFWDEKGKKQVTKGNGQWYQYESDEHFVKIEGEVVNGRQNGKWNRRVPSKNFVMNIEQYEYGKFIKGKLLTLRGTSEKYNDKRFCVLEIAPAFETAETFQLNQCFPKTHNKWVYATYPGGQDAFFSEIKQKFNYSEGMVNANVRGVIEVQTTIDEEGEMGNFKLISHLGGGAEEELIRVLRTMKKWSPKKLNGKPTIQPKIIRFEIR